MNRIFAAAAVLMLIGGTALAQEQEEAAQESMMGVMNMRPGMEMSEADRGYDKAMRSM